MILVNIIEYQRYFVDLVNIYGSAACIAIMKTLFVAVYSEYNVLRKEMFLSTSLL